MRAKHLRAAAREIETAKAFGTTSVHRSRYASAPDVLGVRLYSGEVLQPEVQTRKRAPQLITSALAQARRYAPSAIPVAVVSQTGGEAIACLPLRDFVRLLGLQDPKLGQQLALLAKPPEAP